MLHSNHYVLAALVGLAAIFSSCSVKEDFDTCKKSQVQLDVRAFGIEQSAFTKASADKDPHRIVLKAFDASAYDTAGNLNISHELKGVPMKRICLTVAGGNFFSLPPASGRFPF